MRKKFLIPAIIIGGGKTALAITRSLGMMKIPAASISYSKSDICAASKYFSDRFIITDPAENSDELTDFLKNLGNKFRNSVLFPSDYISVNIISKHKQKLSKYFVIPTEKWEVISKIHNNNLVFDAAEKTGIPAPRTIRATTLDQAEWFAEETGYPVLMKPDLDNNLIDLFRTEAVLIENYSHLKNIFTIAHKFGKKVILQEFIPSDGVYGAVYLSYFHKGRPVLEFTMQSKRISQYPGSFPRVLMSRNIPEIFEPARKLIRTLKFSGFSSVEFIKDKRNGIYKFANIAPGYSITAHLAAKCGINFPYETYVHNLKGIVPEERSHFKEGLYWIDLIQDVTQTISRNNYESFHINDFIQPYLHKKIYSVPSLKDPLPMVKTFREYLKTVPNYFVEMIIKKRFQQI